MNELKRIKAQHKINRESNSIQLPQSFVDKFPNLKHEKAQMLFVRYIDSIRAALMKQLAFLKDGRFQVSLHDIQIKCGTFNVNKSRYSVWNEFNAYCPIIKVIEKGSNLTGRNSIVEISDNNLKRLLFNSPYEKMYDGIFGEAESVGVQPEWLDIDQDNLANFIGNCDVQLAYKSAGKSKAWGDKIRRNQVQALVVARIAAENDGRFPQYPKASIFGRTYYWGLSIQNMSKEVRSAALGEHFQYDMSAAIFGIKLAVISAAVASKNDKFPEYKLEGRYTYTKEYVREKDRIRTKLANDCISDARLGLPKKIKIIKDAITAIGFGAKTDGIVWSVNSLPALHEIIKNKDDRARFMEHNWVKKFIAEQEELTFDIIEHVKSVGSYEAIKSDIKNAGNAKRVTDAHILAYLFQTYETQIMDDVVAVARRQTPVLARIHDAFVTAEKLTPATLEAIDDVLSSAHSLLKMEEEFFWKWRPVEEVKSGIIQEQFESEHRRQIKQEEHEARMEITTRATADILASMAPAKVVSDDELEASRLKEFRRNLVIALNGQTDLASYLYEAVQSGEMTEDEAYNAAQEFEG